MQTSDKPQLHNSFGIPDSNIDQFLWTKGVSGTNEDVSAVEVCHTVPHETGREIMSFLAFSFLDVFFGGKSIHNGH